MDYVCQTEFNKNVGIGLKFLIQLIHRVGVVLIMLIDVIQHESALHDTIDINI